MLSYIAPTGSTNTICANHSAEFQQGVLDDQLWAVRMLDSSSKLEAGALAGNIHWLGSYDECLGVTAPGGRFTGQLCVITTRGLLPPLVPRPNTGETPAGDSPFALVPTLPLEIVLSMCLPSSCSTEDVAVHWRDVMAEFNASASIRPGDCSVKGDRQPDIYMWMALGVIGLLCVLVTASTCYDHSVAHQPLKERRILLCFSAYNSLRKLFHADRQSDRLNVLDGLRVLAICWVVLGHRFDIDLQVPNLTLRHSEKYTTGWFMAPLLNVNLSVEVFFLLSGCLLAYHYLGAQARAERFNLKYFYYKRFIRLTPALAATVLLEGCIILYVSDGPLWSRLVGHRVESCRNYWWSTLLYVNNYVNPFNTCVLQSWYLAADTQLYVLSPLLLVPLLKPRCRVMLLYIATTSAAFFNAYYFHLAAGTTATLDRKTEQNHGYEYVKTHLRAASWLTGLALGYILHSWRGKEQPVRLSKMAALVAWLSCLSLIIGSVYSVAPFQKLEYHYNPIVDSLHIAIHRNLFSIGIAGVILMCVTGQGGFVKDFLGWSGFRPLGTLSYCVYLCHMGLQNISMGMLRQPFDFDMFSLFTGFMSDILQANLMAVALYVLVEAPFWEIGRWLYTPDKPTTEVAPERCPPVHINMDQEKSKL